MFVFKYFYRNIDLIGTKSSEMFLYNYDRKIHNLKIILYTWDSNNVYDHQCESDVIWADSTHICNVYVSTTVVRPDNYMFLYIGMCIIHTIIVSYVEIHYLNSSRG